MRLYFLENRKIFVLRKKFLDNSDFVKLQKAISEYMDKSISFYDGGSEGFYHGLILGLIALMDNHYKIKSNRESGDGRYDICLFPKTPKYPGIIMEFKWGSYQVKIHTS